MFDRDAGPCNAGLDAAWRGALSFIQHERTTKDAKGPGRCIQACHGDMPRRLRVHDGGATRNSPTHVMIT